MIIPAMVPFTLFLALPIGVAAYYSLHAASGFGGVGEFVGIDNYVQALGDAELWRSLGRNFFLAAATLVLSVGGGFVLAFFLFRRVAGWRYLQVALFLPFVLPIAVTGLMWIFIYEPNLGLLNAFLGGIGLDSLTGLWLSDPDVALPASSFVWAWRMTPFVMLLLFGAMLRIPDEVIEAAQLDGATERTLMARIVLPLVAPTFWLTCLLVIVTTFRTFDLMWILTQGGPQGATRIAPLYLYEQGFSYVNYGYANAIGFIIAVVVAIPVAIIMRRLNKAEV
jgi:ABC-type sugar transport system permease subunit